MVRRESFEVRTGMGGGTGKGEAYVCEIVSKEELHGHGRFFAKVILPPGSTIGWHTHEHETEPYYILSGEGDFHDTDGSVVRVHGGDICTIDFGGSHALENNGTEDLVMIALIYNE